MSLRQAKKLLSQRNKIIESQEDSLIDDFSGKKFSFADYSITSEDSSGSPGGDFGESNSESRESEIEDSSNVSSIEASSQSPLDSELDSLDGLDLSNNFKGLEKGIFSFNKTDLNFKYETDKSVQSFNPVIRNRRGNFLSKMHWLIQEPSTAIQSKLAHSNITMKCYPDKSRTHLNAVLFKLEPSTEYNNVLSMIKRAIDNQDINLISDLLKQSPLHIYGLLKFVDIYNLQNDKQEAFNTLKLALKVLQLSFHKDFNPFNLDKDGHPMVMMDSELYNNRVLIVGLLMFMIYCEKQTCYKTALALGKLLLAIDLRNDKSHILLHIDHYFITLGDVNQILNFSQEFNNHRTRVLTGRSADLLPLQFMLPNFALGLALILHSNSPFQATVENLYEFLNLNAIKLGSFSFNSQIESEFDRIDRFDLESSNIFLIRALILFPYFISALVETLRIRSIGDKKLISKLDSISKVKPFTLGGLSEYEYLTRVHCACTSAKNAEIWSTNTILTWLVEGCEWLSNVYKQDDMIGEYRKVWITKYKTDMSQSISLGDMYSYRGISPAEFAHPHNLPMELSD